MIASSFGNVRNKMSSEERCDFAGRESANATYKKSKKRENAV